MVVPLSLSYLQVFIGTYNSSGITMRPITAKVLWMVSGEQNSAEEFSVTSNKFVPSIGTLFQIEKDLLWEPDDINQSPSVPPTIQIHKLVRSSTAEGGTIIDFYFFSNGKEPSHTQSYLERKCGHAEREYESLALFRSLCAYCMKKYLEEKEAENLLKRDLTVNNNNNTWQE